MSHLEKQVAALVRLCAAREEGDRAAAREELRALADQAPVESADVEGKARRVLTQIGVPERLVGHSYLLRALVLTAADSGAVRGATRPGGLYHKIAGEFGTTMPRVERGIRHGIEVAWSRCDWEVLMTYFGNTVSPDKGKPTNLEFIARLASVVREGE